MTIDPDQLQLFNIIAAILSIFLSFTSILLAIFTIIWSARTQSSNDKVNQRTEVFLTKIEEKSVITQRSIEAIVNKTHNELFSLLKQGRAPNTVSTLPIETDENKTRQRSKFVHDILLTIFSEHPDAIKDIDELTSLYHTDALTIEDYSHLVEEIEKHKGTQTAHRST